MVNQEQPAPVVIKGSSLSRIVCDKWRSNNFWVLAFTAYTKDIAQQFEDQWYSDKPLGKYSVLIITHLPGRPALIFAAKSAVSEDDLRAWFTERQLLPPGMTETLHGRVLAMACGDKLADLPLSFAVEWLHRILTDQHEGA